eukprot:PhF_6_TR13404/c0_g1_i2/m.21327
MEGNLQLFANTVLIHSCRSCHYLWYCISLSVLQHCTTRPVPIQSILPSFSEFGGLVNILRFMAVFSLLQGHLDTTRRHRTVRHVVFILHRASSVVLCCCSRLLVLPFHHAWGELEDS